MIRKNTLTVNEMHDINRSAILDYIRRRGPTSRPSIARELHFSLPTVMRVIDELIAEDLVISTGETEFSGGRRRPLLEINSRGTVIIGVDLGGTEIYAAATDLCGNVLVEQKAANQPVSAEASYARLAGLIAYLVRHAEIAGRKILGVAVGTQGLTNQQAGIVLRDPMQNWHNYPLKQKLYKDFGVPIVIDNDVNLAALGEHWFGAGQSIRNMVLITTGAGIGAGIIIDGLLYRSSNHLAGEIGYFLPDKQYLGKRWENFGFLESRASLAAVAEHAHALLMPPGVQESAEGPRPTPEDVFKAMLDSQPWALGLIEAMVDDLSFAIANTCALLDPDLIVLRSSLDQYTDLLIDPILRRIEGTVPIKPNLVASTLGYKATALGAIVEVLYDTKNFYSIRMLR
jgi:glucokinase